jgi:hypothetical protein
MCTRMAAVFSHLDNVHFGGKDYLGHLPPLGVIVEVGDDAADVNLKGKGGGAGVDDVLIE